MQPIAITTFSPEYYELYGREGLASFAKYWPGPVIAYVEGEVPADCPSNVECRDLGKDKEFCDFTQWSMGAKFFSGILPNGTYNHHYNLAKFGRKVFAITDPNLREPFFFLGADTRILKPIPENFLTAMLKDRLGTFLFRDHLQMHLESDFAGYNPLHPKWEHLRQSYRVLYTSGSVTAVPHGTNDCWTLEYLLNEMNLKRECYDITNGVRGDDKYGLHVWPKTPLGEYMVHLKGRRKKQIEEAA